ncbi:MAG TPA: hypothetical protein ENN29_01620 [Candidatus Hydrogenedentes bacterium]|nr:hypothetical protein [Candidatus Hydrogenedentota bacterium]
MDEMFEPMDDLDALIREALADEPFLKAPITLQRGVEARLRIAHLRDHEKTRFAMSMATLAVVLIASLAMAAVVVWFTKLSFLYSEGVSGGKGQFDYYITALTMTFSSYQGAYSLVASFVLAVAACVVALVMQVHKLMFTE